jgi:hypothetical protein
LGKIAGPFKHDISGLPFFTSLKTSSSLIVLTQSLSNIKLRFLFGFFYARPLFQASLIRDCRLISFAVFPIKSVLPKAFQTENYVFSLTFFMRFRSFKHA